MITPLAVENPADDAAVREITIAALLSLADCDVMSSRCRAQAALLAQVLRHGVDHREGVKP